MDTEVVGYYWIAVILIFGTGLFINEFKKKQ